MIPETNDPQTDSSSPAPTVTELWLDPTFGASGDMFLGAFVGLGVPLADIEQQLNHLDIDGWKVSESEVLRSSLNAARVEVVADETHHHRTWSSIDALLAGSPLPEAVIAGARSTFRALGEAEAEIHGVSIDEVHFHEVGAIDAIVDIVGCWIALDILNVESVASGPVGIGHGTVQAAHGTLPLPAPATAALLQGVSIQTLDTSGETVTPTGAALLATMVSRWGPLPNGVLETMARGAGGRDPESHPNVLSAYLVSSVAKSSADLATTSTVALLQTNLDDVSGEVVAYTIDQCLEAGADDAWAQPITMKKGRPAVELQVLCRHSLIDELRSLIFAETATLGIRTSFVSKHVLERRFETVVVEEHAIRIKIGPFGIKPEFDDLASAAKQLGCPLSEVRKQALDTYYKISSAPQIQGDGRRE